MLDRLLKDCNDFGGERTAPPNDGKPTPIVTVFLIERITAVEEIGKIFSVIGLILQIWSVETCPAPTGTSMSAVDRIFLTDTSKLWMPALRFLSTTGDVYLNKGQVGSDLLGTIDMVPYSSNFSMSFFYTTRGEFETQCEFNLKNFPFDTQHCGFTFSHQNALDSVIFGNTYILCPTEVNTEWTFDKCGFDFDLTTWQGRPIQTVTFRTTVTRKPAYYITNLVLPNLILFFLGLGTFVLPINRPERPFFSVTLLLSQTVALSFVLSTVPKYGGEMLLTKFLSEMSYMEASITLYEMVIYCCASAKLIKPTIARIIDVVVFLFVSGLFSFFVFSTFLPYKYQIFT